MSTNEQQVKRYAWLHWLGIAGLVAVIYQLVNIVQAFVHYWSLATLLYTVEIILMVLLTQISVALLKRSWRIK